MRKWPLFVVMTLLLAGGCQQDSSPASSSTIGSKPALLWAPQPHKIPGVLAYVVRHDFKINGQPVGQDAIVYGMVNPNFVTVDHQNPKFVLAPEYWSIVGNEKCIYAKRVGDEFVTQYELVDRLPTSPKATEYTGVVRKQLRNDGPEVLIGLNTKTNIATVLNDAGQPVERIEIVADYFNPSKSDELASKKAYIVHGDGFDLITDSTGIPMSPKLPKLWSTQVNREVAAGEEWQYDPKLFAMVIDAQKKLYWPVLENGKVFPKPDDCLGITPLIGEYLGRERWAGWLVWWKTSSGDRCAWVDVDVPSKDFAALVASRKEAKWSEVFPIYKIRSFYFVRREEPNGPYRAEYGDYRSTTLASVEAARKFIDDAFDRTCAENDRRDAQAKRMQMEIDIARQRTEAENKKAEQARLEAIIRQIGKDFDAALARGDKGESRRLVLQLFSDPARWTAYVKKFGLDRDENKSDSIGYSRAQLGGTAPEVLSAAMEKLNPFPATPAGPQSDWDYFWNGPRDGSASSVPSPSGDSPLSHENVMRSLQQREADNARAWLRGAQNWGAMKN